MKMIPSQSDFIICPGLLHYGGNIRNVLTQFRIVCICIINLSDILNDFNE